MHCFWAVWTFGEHHIPHNFKIFSLKKKTIEGSTAEKRILDRED